MRAGRGAAGIELVFAVESRAADDHELARRIDIKAHSLFSEAKPHAQRCFEAHEEHRILAEYRVEAFGPDCEVARERPERRCRVGAFDPLGDGRRGVDGRADVLAASNSHGHRDDRIGIEVARITLHAATDIRDVPAGSVRRTYLVLKEGLPFERPQRRFMPQQRNSLAINTDNRVVSVANRGRNAARIPDTPERQRLEKQRSIREIVFGAQDGILTTLGIVTGVGSAAPDRGTILLTGFLSLLVGAISMGVGEYLGGKSEREVVQNAIDFERREMLEMPAEEFEEQLAYYRLKGFADDEAMMIVRRLEKNPDIWLHEMVRDEFGIDVREAESGGFRASFAMAGSFAIGAAFPVIPYIFGIPIAAAAWTGLALAAAVLFAIGYFAGTLSGRNPFFKGFEIVAFGAAVFAISWAAGRYVPALFGHGAIGVGG